MQKPKVNEYWEHISEVQIFNFLFKHAVLQFGNFWALFMSIKLIGLRVEKAITHLNLIISRKQHNKILFI